MQDKNGIEMKTGMVVKIEGAYFKSDNGLYFIAHAPGDPTWCGSDYSLHKITTKGMPKEHHAVGFWPLYVTVSSREKRIAAKKHNDENATIEVVSGIPMNGIKAFFEKEHENILRAMEWEDRNYGSVQEKTIAQRDFYKKVANSMEDAA